MLKILARYALFSFALLPLAAAAAEPIKLKLSFFSSDRSSNYLAMIKPFVDSVNAAAFGFIEIEVFSSGSLGPYPKQVQLVVDGVADIAFVNPSLTPERFPDNDVIGLPGLFRDAREGSLVFTQLVASGAIKGYEDFFVVAALSTDPVSIHVRPPIVTLEDLKGKRIRASTHTDSTVLQALGMAPESIPINQTAAAIISGTIDGATVPPITLLEYGIARVTSYHYLMPIGVAPLTILMNKKKFDSLPSAAQNIIRKYSGEWLAARYVEAVEDKNGPIIEQMKSDPKRKVIAPSQPDLDTAQAVFKTVIQEWRQKSPRNGELLKMVEMEIAKLRAVR